MEDALKNILNVLCRARSALTLFIISNGVLDMLAKNLNALGASAIGARFIVWESLTSIAAVIILVLVVFVGVPPIMRAVATFIPGSLGFGSITDRIRTWPVTFSDA